MNLRRINIVPQKPILSRIRTSRTRCDEMRDSADTKGCVAATHPFVFWLSDSGQGEAEDLQGGLFQLGKLLAGAGFTVGTAAAIAVLAFMLYMLFRKNKYAVQTVKNNQISA